MKIDFGKWLAVLTHLLLAAPALIAAVRPALDAAKAPPRG